jgi:hypothetical protein
MWIDDLHVILSLADYSRHRNPTREFRCCAFRYPLPRHVFARGEASLCTAVTATHDGGEGRVRGRKRREFSGILGWSTNA